MFFVAYKGKEIQRKTASNPKEELFQVSILLTGLLPITKWIFIHLSAFGNVFCKEESRIRINGTK